MQPHDPSRHYRNLSQPTPNPGLDLRATRQCLNGCGTGEVLGIVIGTALGWSNASAIMLAVGLAFVFGYAFTARALWVEGIDLPTALSLALGAGTASITIMETVANVVMLAIPGAMDAPLISLQFWASLVLSLLIAGAAGFRVTLYLMRAGVWQVYPRAHHKHGLVAREPL